jgi:hypothetical protein
LAAESLDGAVTVVRAPLSPFSPAWPHEEAIWYEQDSIRAATAGQRIDLLIVDGPPARQPGRNHSRYPAVPFFAAMLSDDYAIILDDIDRPAEREIVKCWERHLDITFERRYVAGGVAIGRPGAAFNI